MLLLELSKGHIEIFAQPEVHGHLSRTQTIGKCLSCSEGSSCIQDHIPNRFLELGL